RANGSSEVGPVNGFGAEYGGNGLNGLGHLACEGLLFLFGHASTRTGCAVNGEQQAIPDATM
ncbi:MAG: hypothetical protein M1546_15510, partial [Chloroflexi bacterium]|nr:hypothetical protein [Chloroflexota bacterium]